MLNELSSRIQDPREEILGICGGKRGATPFKDSDGNCTPALHKVKEAQRCFYCNGDGSCGYDSEYTTSV